MMYYFAEYARAKRAVRIAAILLGIFLLCAIIVRIVAATHHHGSIQNWPVELQHSPTAHVTRTTLADGSTHIVVNDPPRRTHAEIFQRPSGRVDMDVTEPKSASGSHEDFSFGSVSIHETTRGPLDRTIIHYNPSVPAFDLGICFFITILMGLIVASLLGGALSKDNDGHLEVAWTKPVSREHYAVAAAVVDAVAILFSQLLTFAVMLIATLLFFVPRFSYGSDLGWTIVLSLALPIAWYACITAASASLKRGPGIVVGLGWLVALLVPGIADALHSLAAVNGVAAWFYAIFRALSYIDPLAYLSHSSGGRSNALLPIAGCAGVLCALSVAYVALAVAQWRRVEA